MITEEVRQIPAVQALEVRFAAAITAGFVQAGQAVVEVDPAGIVDVCRYLKHDEKFVRLAAVTAVDRYPMEPRFEIVYLLHSIERNLRLRLKCRLGGEQPEIDSVTEIWVGANWYERETYDLFGIHFRNHPDLTRIMMPDQWEGHPLRKDFPTHGYKYSYVDE
jgi:NADH-quinone oxidoreductase subunit C